MKHIKSVKYPMPSKFHGSVRRFAHRVGKNTGGGEGLKSCHPS